MEEAIEKQRAYEREKKRKYIEKLKQDPVKYQEYLDRRRNYDKAYRKSHREYENKKKRRRNNKITIGTLIKDEVLNQPTWGTKGLWDGIGMWSRKYGTECYECGRTVYKHKAQGLCTQCYERLRIRSEESVNKKKFNKKMKEKEYKENQSRKSKIALEFLGKAINGELRITEMEKKNIIQNLLENLEIGEIERQELLQKAKKIPVFEHSTWDGGDYNV